MVPALNKAEEQRSERRQRAGGQLSGGNNQVSTTNQKWAEVEGSDGFEGEIVSLGEEDEPPDNPDSATITTEDAADNRGGKNEQANKREHQPQMQQPHPIEGTRGGTTRSGRRIKVTACAREGNLQRGKQWVAWIAGLADQPEVPEEDKI
jgi:hypothetical protein